MAHVNASIDLVLDMPGDPDEDYHLDYVRAALAKAVQDGVVLQRGTVLENNILVVQVTASSTVY